MKILIACLDGELLWAIDDAISGLYLIDQRTFETKCVIGCRELYPNGRFIIQSLMKWKEDYIVIIPREINRKWIFYNKVTGKTEYRKIIERKCQEILLAVDEGRKQIYFFPLYVYDPIIIVDLDTLTCSQIIENWSEKEFNKEQRSSGLTAWKGAYDGQYVFFPIKNTKILVRMDCYTRNVKLLELDVSENLVDVDFFGGELWILPMSGNQLYQADQNGRIVNTAKLSVRNTEDSLPAFARIVVQKRVLFLLPCYRKGIYVYDKLEGNTHIIPKQSTILEKEKEIHLRYWEFYVWNHQICFLPFRDQCLEINLDTLVYRKQELDYPSVWSAEEKTEKIILSHVSESDTVIRETDGCDQEIFLKYIRDKADKEELSSAGYAGKKIWNMLKD